MSPIVGHRVDWSGMTAVLLPVVVALARFQLSDVEIFVRIDCVFLGVRLDIVRVSVLTYLPTAVDYHTEVFLAVLCRCDKLLRNIRQTYTSIKTV